MDELDQKRAADQLDLYRTDGRNYDLSEKEGVLTLRLRRSVRVDRAIVVVLVSVLICGMLMAWAWTLRYEVNSADSVSRGVFVFLAMQPIQFAVNFVINSKKGEVWIFDKSAPKVQCNSSPITDFSKICSVRAWRRGSRFYVALKMRYGHTIRLGGVGRFFPFCRSERSWRDDATQIAQFLDVPLDIPPV